MLAEIMIMVWTSVSLGIFYFARIFVSHLRITAPRSRVSHSCDTPLRFLYVELLRTRSHALRVRHPKDRDQADLSD